MKACTAVRDQLKQVSAQLEALALSFEPAEAGPSELRAIAELVDQFEQRPLEPLSFQQAHLDHLVDMLDNADDPIEMWSVVTQTLADYYVSQHYGNQQDEIVDNYLEIEPALICFAHQCHLFITQQKITPEQFKQHRENIMEQVGDISNMLTRIRENNAV